MQKRRLHQVCICAHKICKSDDKYAYCVAYYAKSQRGYASCWAYMHNICKYAADMKT